MRNPFDVNPIIPTSSLFPSMFDVGSSMFSFSSQSKIQNHQSKIVNPPLFPWASPLTSRADQTVRRPRQCWLVGTANDDAYYVILEGMTGRTLGKLITGTKVVNERGEPPSFGQILGRTFSRFIPFEVFSFLAEDGRGWHDSVPGTYVGSTR